MNIAHVIAQAFPDSLITVACIDEIEVRKHRLAYKHAGLTFDGRLYKYPNGSAIEFKAFTDTDQPKGQLRDYLIVPWPGIPNNILDQLKIRTKTMFIEMYNR